MIAEPIKTATLTDNELVAWIDEYRARYKFSKSDVLKLAIIEFRERHNSMGHSRTREDKLAESARLYHAAGDSLQPGMLQRRGVAESYAEACSLIQELVARGEVDPARTQNVVDMSNP